MNKREVMNGAVRVESNQDQIDIPVFNQNDRKSNYNFNMHQTTGRTFENPLHFNPTENDNYKRRLYNNNNNNKMNMNSSMMNNNDKTIPYNNQIQRNSFNPMFSSPQKFYKKKKVNNQNNINNMNNINNINNQKNKNNGQYGYNQGQNVNMKKFNAFGNVPMNQRNFVNNYPQNMNQMNNYQINQLNQFNQQLNHNYNLNQTRQSNSNQNLKYFNNSSQNFRDSQSDVSGSGGINSFNNNVNKSKIKIINN
jgi:hypothetical protein